MKIHAEAFRVTKQALRISERSVKQYLEECKVDAEEIPYDEEMEEDAHNG